MFIIFIHKYVKCIWIFMKHGTSENQNIFVLQNKYKLYFI